MQKMQIDAIQAETNAFAQLLYSKIEQCGIDVSLDLWSSDEDLRATIRYVRSEQRFEFESLIAHITPQFQEYGMGNIVFRDISILIESAGYRHRRKKFRRGKSGKNLEKIVKYFLECHQILIEAIRRQEEMARKQSELAEKVNQEFGSLPVGVNISYSAGQDCHFVLSQVLTFDQVRRILAVLQERENG